jgi:carotenoid cleavage dioxygenase
MGHDIAFTEHYTILPDFPMFWDPEKLAEGRFVPKLFRDMPSRFAVIPRYGQTSEIRWFEADPTWVMHWTNAHEDGDEIVLDGFFAENPSVGKDPDPNFTGIYGLTRRYLDIHQSRTKAHRWRFNLATGQTKEETLSDRIAEFGMVNGRQGGRPNRFGYMMSTTPGMFLFNGIVKFDFETNHEEVFQFADGMFASETPMAPRTGAQGEDDGYLVTFVTDMNADRSECWIFSAEDLAAGPLARVALPERISSGTHACWAPASALGSPR